MSVSQEDLLSLKVGSVLHHLSIKRAIQVLRLNSYEPSCLRRRPSDEVSHGKSRPTRFHFCFKAFLKAIFGSTCLWYAFFFFFTRSSRSRTTSHRQRSPSGQTTEWWSGSAPWIWQNTPQIWEAAVFMEDWWWDGRRIRGQFGWIRLNFTIPLGNNYGLSKLKNMLKEILLQK